SFGVDWFLKHVLQIIPESLPVLAVTKGMENMPDGRFISFPELYKEKLPNRGLSLNAIGGPCTSYELADKNHSLVCFCGDDMNMLRMLKDIFKTSYYNISLSTDVLGVECAVALKNVYALGVALAIGLAEKRDGVGSIQHYNTQAALFGQSIREIRKILAIVGGIDENIYLSAGDLYVTVFGGRTRLIGTLLGRGLSFDEAMEELKGETLESIAIAKRTAIFIKGLLEKDKVRVEEFPLLLHIDDIISRGAPVDIPWDKFEFETKI
ncbi:MAG: glycerol-3-phosphate dehydrogenase, partial [Clostridiales bacterium]|nr:glycerol-3-phosphate dehydrogenase [Clostridiales bacterium]